MSSRGFDGLGVNRLLHRAHHDIALARWVHGTEAEEPGQEGARPAEQGRRAQRRIELRIPCEIEPVDQALRHAEALHDLDLAGHHVVGRRVVAQDALQLSRGVGAGFVEHRRRPGIARRRLRDRDEGEHRDQRGRRDEGQLPPPQHREQREEHEDGGRPLLIGLGPVHRPRVSGPPGSRGDIDRSVEHTRLHTRPFAR